MSISLGNYTGEPNSTPGHGKPSAEDEITLAERLEETRHHRRKQQRTQRRGNRISPEQSVQDRGETQGIRIHEGKKNQVSARVIGSRENEGRGGNMKAILRNNGPQFSNFCENDHLQIPEAHWSKDRKCNERSMHTVSKLVKTNRERVL